MNRTTFETIRSIIRDVAGMSEAEATERVTMDARLRDMADFVERCAVASKIDDSFGIRLFIGRSTVRDLVNAVDARKEKQ